jgi:RNA recognition motif-containing protein
MSEDEVRIILEPYGKIVSLALTKEPMGQFGFACFESEAIADQVINELHGKKDMGNGLKLYVTYSLSKE